MSNARKSHSPIEPAEADKLLNCLAEYPSLALAVSGGSDSMAILYLYHSWRKRRAVSQKCAVLSVDHGLRIEAAKECCEVSKLCNSLDLDHKTLEWQGTKPESNIQAIAREARYDLMADAMRSLGIRHLVLAHHLDDQAETFLIRLARGSGVYGLSAMSPQSTYGQIVLIRPLLAIPKQRLVATLEQANWKWFEDPTNKKETYARGKIRKIMPEIAKVGLTASRLADTAARIRRTAEAINFSVDQLASVALTKHCAGPVRLALEPVQNAPEEVGLRLLARVISETGGKSYVPRQYKVENLYQKLFPNENGRFKSATVGGAMFLMPTKDVGHVWIFREPGREIEKLSISRGNQAIWDGRFSIVLSDAAPAEVTVSPLKDELPWMKHLFQLPQDWPKKAFFGTPVVKWPHRMDGESPTIHCISEYFIHGISQDVPAWLKISPQQ